MSREIKFRAWDGKKMKQLVAKQGNRTTMIYPLQHAILTPSQANRPVMQYTGLTDANGIEIYEGDICWDSHHEYYGEVVFDEGAYRYVWDSINESLFEAADGLQVVGNIHENGDLMETAS